jgi:hypothetical protein
MPDHGYPSKLRRDRTSSCQFPEFSNTLARTPVETNDPTQWIPVDKPMWLFTTTNPTQEYESTVYIDGLKKFGVCTVFCYVNGGNRLTLFIDKQTQWIDEILMTSPSSDYYNGVLTKLLCALKSYLAHIVDRGEGSSSHT